MRQLKTVAWLRDTTYVGRHFPSQFSFPLYVFYIFFLMQTFILFLIIYFIFKLVHSDGRSGFQQGEHVPSFS